MTDDDHDLRRVFRAARDAERSHAPPFRRVLDGRPRRPRRSVLVPGLLALGCAAAVAGMVVVLRPPASPAADLELARRVMAWRSPTDFLLPANAPGLLSSVPRIGQAPSGSPLRALDPGNVLGPPLLLRSPRS